MAIDYMALRNWRVPVIEQSLTWRDCALYALGCGVGSEAPQDRDELRFVYEPAMQVLPTMAAVIATPGFWLKDPATGIDWKQVLHGEQMLEIHGTLPISGRIRGTTRVDDIFDKGEGRGAVLYQRRELHDIDTGALIATVRQSNFLRGDGGFGGASEGAPKPHPMPEGRAADRQVDLKTRHDQALLYRLSGDHNPLHIDPEIAVQAGFDKPILHGLGTFGVVGRALIRLLCNEEPSALRRIELRFSAPVYPGETIRTQVWDEGGGQWSFRALSVDRNIVVLNNGRVWVA